VGDMIKYTSQQENIKNIIGYKGKINFNKNKPDGTPRKIMNNKIIKSLGWQPKITLKEGLVKAYKDFLNRSWKK
jgi:GDP-L-fucose synthase